MLPRFGAALTGHGMLAVISDVVEDAPWNGPLREICARYSTNRAYRPYDVIDEIESRGLFRVHGRNRTASISFTQSVKDYVDSFHARNGFSRDRMTPGAAAAFDRAATAVVLPFAPDGNVTLRVAAEIVWGSPTAG